VPVELNRRSVIPMFDSPDSPPAFLACIVRFEEWLTDSGLLRKPSLWNSQLDSTP